MKIERQLVKTGIGIMILLLGSGCGIFDADSSHQNGSFTKLYVTLQGLDQVAVYDAENLELIRTVDTDFTPGESVNTPHFVIIDEDNGFWFVTLIASGYVAMYDLGADMLVDTVQVGDSPALMALDPLQKRLFCSRMMPMGGMMTGAVSQVIQEIDYSQGSLQLVGEFSVNSPAPHGITIDPATGVIVTTSNTADWIYKIDLTSGIVTGAVMDGQASAPPYVEIQRLKSIQCVTVAPGKIIAACSAGIWMDPYSGTETQIPGIVQLWDTPTMTSTDTLQFNWHSRPWHAVKSPASDNVFIVLSGDGQVGSSAGIACVRYDQDELHLEWIFRSPEFHTLHGIDISADESRVYITSRSNGILYALNAQTGEIISSVWLSDNPDMVLAGGVAVMKNN